MTVWRRMCVRSEKARVTQCLQRGRECNGDRDTDYRVFPPSPPVSVCTGLPHILQDPGQSRSSLNLQWVFPCFGGWAQHILTSRQSPCASQRVPRQHPGVALPLLEICPLAKPIKFCVFFLSDTSSWLLWAEGLDSNGDFFLWSILCQRRGKGRKKASMAGGCLSITGNFWLSRNITRKYLVAKSGYQGGLRKHCPGMRDWIRKVRRQLHLKLVRDVQGIKKGYCRYVSTKGLPRKAFSECWMGQVA